MSTDEVDGRDGSSVSPTGVSERTVEDCPKGIQELSRGATNAELLRAYLDPDELVVKDLYTWEHVKRKYHYADDDGSPPLDVAGDPVPFDAA